MSTSSLRAAAIAALLVAALAVPASSQTATVPKMDVSCFSLHAQGDPNVIHEMAVRLQSLGDEFLDALKPAAPVVRSRMNIYVFSKQEDYLKMGGTKEGGPVLALGEGRLVMLVPPGATPEWNALQETILLLFAGGAFSEKMPQWACSGLGTYYRVARWTGDGMAAGIVPPELIRQVRFDQSESKSPPLDKVVPLNLAHWYQDPDPAERTRKAWAMIQFLMHGDGGKYRQAFGAYVQDSVKGDATAFSKCFGAGGKDFQTHYDQWLASPQAEPNDSATTQAVVATLTSFLARGHALKMKFASWDEFLHAAKDGKLQVDWAKNPTLWLPPDLLKQNLDDAEKLGTWSLDTKRLPPAIVLTQSDGTTYTGTFTLPEGRRPLIKVEKKDHKAGSAASPAPAATSPSPSTVSPAAASSPAPSSPSPAASSPAAASSKAVSPAPPGPG